MFLGLLAALLGAGFLLAALFAAWPGVDLWAARQFYVEGEGFPLGAKIGAMAPRRAYRLLSDLTFLLMLWFLLAALRRRGAARVPVRIWAFGLGLFALGPGLLVDVILKNHWGRARPDVVAAFGGPARFTPPFAISDQCARNCSFVSGEGAGTAAVACVAIALFWPMLGRGAPRIVAATALLAFALGVMFVRMAPGRHFVSDLLFSFILVGLTAMLLYAILDIGAARRGLEFGDFRRDLAASFTFRWRRAKDQP